MEQGQTRCGTHGARLIAQEREVICVHSLPLCTCAFSSFFMPHTFLPSSCHIYCSRHNQNRNSYTRSSLSCSNGDRILLLHFLHSRYSGLVTTLSQKYQRPPGSCVIYHASDEDACRANKQEACIYASTKTCMQCLHAYIKKSPAKHWRVEYFCFPVKPSLVRVLVLYHLHRAFRICSRSCAATLSWPATHR